MSIYQTDPRLDYGALAVEVNRIMGVDKYNRDYVRKVHKRQLASARVLKVIRQILNEDPVARSLQTQENK